MAVLTGQGDYYFQVSGINFGHYTDALGAYQDLQVNSGHAKLAEYSPQKGEQALKLQIKIQQMLTMGRQPHLFKLSGSKTDLWRGSVRR